MFDENNKDDQLKLLQKLIKLRSESSGNYDGFFGVVSNYDWTFDNGVYNINLKLMSLGAMAESLLIKSTSPKVTLTENEVERQKELAFLNTYKNHNDIATLLFEAASIPFDFFEGPIDEETQEIINNADEEEDTSDNNFSPEVSDYMREVGNENREGISTQDQIEVITRSETRSVEISVKQEQDAIGTPPPQFFSLKDIANAVGFSSDIEFGKISRTNKANNQTSTTTIPDSDKSIMRINRELPSSDGTSTTDPLVYIRFSALLEFLEKTQMVYNPLQKDNPSLLFIDYTINNNYMVCSELTVSASPSTVLVNVGEIINNGFYGLDESTRNQLKNSKSITTTELPQFKEKIGGKTSGKVMNIYLNAKYLVNLLISIQNEQNKIPVFSFLTSICKEINNSLGDIGSIVPFIDETTNTLKIIEEGVLPNKNELLKNKFKEDTLEIPLELFGYNNFETSTPSSGFVKNFGIKTQVTNDLMATISIGAQAKGLNAEYDGTAFSNWNRGLIDRLVSIKDVEPESSPPSQSLHEKYETQLQGYKELLKLTEERFFSIPSAKSSLHGVLKFNQEYVIVNKEKPVTTPSFLPLNFNFTIDGMSGINIFNVFKTNSRFLPYPFPESLEFTVMGVSHKISNNVWTTTVDSLSIPLSEDVKVDPKDIPFVTPPPKEIDENSCEVLIVDGFETPPIYEGKAIRPPKRNSSLRMNLDTKREILPILESDEFKRKYTKGHRMIALAYAIKEGYKKGSRSYVTLNPGNIGNTDNGARNPQPSLRKGVELLMNYFETRANGTEPGWEFGPKTIPQYYSKEIANNPKTYQRPNGCLPGYTGDYQGQIGYFVKRYATFARVNNNGISALMTIFSINDYPSKIDGNTLLSDLLAYNPPGDIKLK